MSRAFARAVAETSVARIAQTVILATRNSRTSLTASTKTLTKTEQRWQRKTSESGRLVNECAAHARTSEMDSPRNRTALLGLIPGGFVEGRKQRIQCKQASKSVTCKNRQVISRKLLTISHRSIEHGLVLRSCRRSWNNHNHLVDLYSSHRRCRRWDNRACGSR
jgi:hypothetical protein